MAAKQREKAGCAWVALVAICSAFGFIFLRGVFQLPLIISLLLPLVGAMVLISPFIGTPSLSSMIKNGTLILGILLLMYFGFRFMLQSLTEYDPETAQFNVEERVVKSTLIENNDTIPVYTSHRQWRDHYGTQFTGDLTVRERDYLRLKNHLADYTPLGSNFWGSLYDHVERTDRESLDLLMENFRRINAEYDLSQKEFVDMIVSCIQDIPYAFVFEGACQAPEVYEESIRIVLERCPDCCIGEIPYGIQNPVSFIQNLKGDCDTRTVLTYTILKEFGYDVAILNSDFYRHSILGLHIPASGVHKIHNGKRYYLWETTARYFELGQLPESFNNVAHWNVVLTSK